jgi:hypothetical protein
MTLGAATLRQYAACCLRTTCRGKECPVAMLHEVGEQTFSWRPVKGAKKTIEIYAGPRVFGTLQRGRGVPTVAQTDEGRWIFEKENGAIAVRAQDGTTLARFVAEKGGHGTVTLADGQTFRWAPTQKGKAERAFYDLDGQRVVRFWRDWQFVKVEDRGAADPGMAALPAFPLLVILGRVIGIGMDDDMAAAAVIASTSV